MTRHQYFVEAENLTRRFKTKEGELTVFEYANFGIQKGEFVCIIGHSGCGKSTILNTLAGLDTPTDGALFMEGQEVSGPALERGVVFQNYSLLPWMSALSNVKFAVRARWPNWSKEQINAHSFKYLEMVGLTDGAEHRKPYELSGGMRQRVMIAMALACNPKVLIADEPTTALDATVQAEICDLLKHVQGEFGMSILLISHDLAMVSEMADRIMVMYAGRIVEIGHWTALSREPRHPYTRGLMAAIPHLGAGDAGPLESISGTVPDLTELPAGCAFHPRCPDAIDECRAATPVLVDVGDRLCACHRVEAAT